MKNTLLIIVLIIIALLVIWYFFIKKNSSNIPSYDKCMSEQKTWVDGKICTPCIPDGSALIANPPGTIKNGVCVVEGKSNIKGNIQVSNQRGAVVYGKTNEGMHPTEKTISYGDKFGYLDIINTSVCDPNLCSLPSDFYQIDQSGFLSKSDITIL